MSLGDFQTMDNTVAESNERENNVKITINPIPESKVEQQQNFKGISVEDEIGDDLATGIPNTIVNEAINSKIIREFKLDLNNVTGFDVESWRQVHHTLILAVQKAERAVAVQKAQRRYWLEEICGNVKDDGSLVYSSIWNRPIPLSGSKKRKLNNSTNRGGSKKQSQDVDKNGSSGAKKRKKSTSTVSLEENCVNSSENPSKKRKPESVKKPKKEQGGTKQKTKPIKIVTKKAKKTNQPHEEFNHDYDEVNASAASDPCDEVSAALSDKQPENVMSKLGATLPFPLQNTVCQIYSSLF